MRETVARRSVLLRIVKLAYFGTLRLWPDLIVPTDCTLKPPEVGSGLATGEKPTTNLTRLRRSYAHTPMS
jgi:hypothetical protein